MKMKKILAILLSLIMILSLSIVSAAERPQVFEPEANTLHALGLFQGTENGYELEGVPTRVQATVMLIRLLGQEEASQNGSYRHPFKDVPGWAQSYVGYAYETGLSKGMSATIFGSNLPCDAKMYCTFVLRALGYDDTAGDFSYAEAPFFAYEIGMVNDYYIAYLEEYTFLRDDMVALSYAGIVQPKKDSDQCILQQMVEYGAMDADAAQPCIDLFLANRYSDWSIFANSQINSYDVSYDISIMVTDNETDMEMGFYTSYASQGDYNSGEVTDVTSFTDERGVAYFTEMNGYAAGYAFTALFEEGEPPSLYKCAMTKDEYASYTGHGYGEGEPDLAPQAFPYVESIEEGDDGKIWVNMFLAEHDPNLKNTLLYSIIPQIDVPGNDYGEASIDSCFATKSICYTADYVQEQENLFITAVVIIAGHSYIVEAELITTDNSPGKEITFMAPDFDAYVAVTAAELFGWG